MKKHPMSRDVSGKKNPRYRPMWDRFWDKVDKSGDCWEWTGAITSGGYGSIGVEGKILQAHRFIMDAPDDVCVLHKCDNRSCVNPDHLYFGDKKQNAKDRDVRHRNGMQKLTNEEIIWIYQLGESVAKIRKTFGVSHSVVSRIKRGVSYRHLTQEATNRGLDRRSTG